MMFKKFLSVLLVLFFLINGTVTGKSHATSNMDSNLEKVLVVYQERSFFADQRDTVSVIEELLGHLKVEIKETNVDNFGANNLRDFDAIFVIALDQNIHNEAMINKLSTFNGRIIWLGSSVENLIETRGYPLTYEGENYDFITVDYSPNGQVNTMTFPIGSKRQFYQVKSLSEKNRVYSWLSDGKNRAPFIIESDNLTYVSRVDMNEPLFYIFAEYLLQVFSGKNLPSNQIMVSIQDVHGFSDQQNLRALADRMNELNMPFNIQLIPYFKMKGSSKLYSYEDIPNFVDTLKYVEAKGGSIVVEAYPVELTDKTVSAISLESVVGDSNAPLKTYFEQVFLKLVKDGLKPRGYSSPHKELSDAELLYARAHIMNYVGLRYISDGQTVIYPYVLDKTKRFQRFYPLNLGYIDPTKVDFWSEYEDIIPKVSVVESKFYGIYFSPDLPVVYIDQLNDKVRAQQLKFFDLSTEPSWVDFEGVKFNSELSSDFTQTIDSDKQSSFQRFVSVFANGVLFILIVGLVLFLYIYNRSIRQTKELGRKR